MAPSCVVCGKVADDGHPFVKNITQTSVSNLINFARKRMQYGETQLAPLVERLASLNQTELEQLPYHSQCYKDIVHKRMLERAEKRFLQSSSTEVVRPAKVGRPSTSTCMSASSREFRMHRRGSSETKEKTCTFLCSNPTEGDLHLVQTDIMGKRFIEIRNKTTNDKVRSSLSLLQDPGDASAYELWYHRDCLRRAERQCEYSLEVDHSVGKCIADIDIINAVKCSLANGVILSMNEINDEYTYMLKENVVPLRSCHYKKELKHLIMENIPEAEFVKPNRHNESEQVMTRQTLAAAVDTAIPQLTEESMKGIAEVAKVLRGELLKHGDTWHFTGSMSYVNPPMVAFFLKLLLFGTESKMVSDKRNDSMSKTISILSQLLVQNVKKSRQVKHVPKSDVGFVAGIQTPLSLGSETPPAKMTDKDAYICALEKKLAELSGIEVDQIKKNQLANAADEARVISEMAAYVASITVQRAGEAQAGIVSPQIADIYSHINAELSEARGAHALPPLKYDYNALEPHISGTIMEIHHTKHHQAYINNLKAASAKLLEAEEHKDVSAMNALLPAIKFNGGGHLNHTIFWTNMSPNGGGEPSGPVSDAINAEFGSFQAFKDKFSAASVGVKGSGWGWLGYSPANDKVAIATCQNQDPLQLTHGLVPLLGLDVWEHAYYLQYKNLRADYVKAFFNVINWSNVNDRYENARKAAGH